MDIVQNSISADATLIEIFLEISRPDNRISVQITDNGKGMSAEMLQKVTSPFVTTRTTRKVGLGISLFKAGAENTGGSFLIDSVLGEGTVVKAVYQLEHLDRPPIGDFSGTVHSLIICNPTFDFAVKTAINGHEETFDTREVRAVLGAEVPLHLPEVSEWIRASMQEVFPPEYAEL